MSSSVEAGAVSDSRSADQRSRQGSASVVDDGTWSASRSYQGAAAAQDALSNGQARSGPSTSMPQDLALQLRDQLQEALRESERPSRPSSADRSRAAGKPPLHEVTKQQWAVLSQAIRLGEKEAIERAQHHHRPSRPSSAPTTRRRVVDDQHAAEYGSKIQEMWVRVCQRPLLMRQQAPKKQEETALETPQSARQTRYAREIQSKVREKTERMKAEEQALKMQLHKIRLDAAARSTLIGIHKVKANTGEQQIAERKAELVKNMNEESRARWAQLKDIKARVASRERDLLKVTPRTCPPPARPSAAHVRVEGLVSQASAKKRKELQVLWQKQAELISEIVNRGEEKAHYAGSHRVKTPDGARSFQDARESKRAEILAITREQHHKIEACKERAASRERAFPAPAW
mmetsp:Transcript_10523/g.23961  ORF Transcript_10523/g.23961 Transcript_10523/m.23961 type:complete len:404 (+) Transcript_10523:1-1212(+)